MPDKEYKTSQRNQILEMLKANKDRHLTVDEMMFILSAMKVQVSRATLYRYLDSLVLTGEVKKFYLGDLDKACFQYFGDDQACKSHFHLVCLECGTLFHLECAHLDEVIKHIGSEHDFNVDQGRVILYGVCKSCREKEL